MEPVLLGIKYDAGWKNQQVRVTEKDDSIIISNYGTH